MAGYLAANGKQHEAWQRAKAARESRYSENPAHCSNCGVNLTYNKRHRKFCGRSCAAKLNNRTAPKRHKGWRSPKESANMANRLGLSDEGALPPPSQTAGRQCLVCSKEIRPLYKEACSTTCRRILYLNRVLERMQNGRQVNAPFVRRLMIAKHGARCMECGWDKPNPKTGKCPIELEHVDGDSTNNRPENLKLLCPNCHSLTPTYKGLNKGRGRHKRRQRYHEQKSY